MVRCAKYQTELLWLKFKLRHILVLYVKIPATVDYWCPIHTGLTSPGDFKSFTIYAMVLPTIFIPCKSAMSVICKIKITLQNTSYVLVSCDDIIPMQISISVIWGSYFFEPSVFYLSDNWTSMKCDHASQHDEQQSTVVLPDWLFWRFKMI